MISSKGKYALRIMLSIGSKYNSNELVTLTSIAQNEELPVKYLEQVISLLVKARLVLSNRGNNGGYRLVKKPSDYSIFEILNATEGYLLAVNNVDYDNTLNNATRIFFNDYNKMIEDYLTKTTLEQLLENHNLLENDYSMYI